jgi:hypothetical protein
MLLTYYLRITQPSSEIKIAILVDAPHDLSKSKVNYRDKSYYTLADENDDYAHNLIDNMYPELNLL